MLVQAHVTSVQAHHPQVNPDVAVSRRPGSVILGVKSVLDTDKQGGGISSDDSQAGCDVAEAIKNDGLPAEAGVVLRKTIVSFCRN